jgi:hypothetical protein
LGAVREGGDGGGLGLEEKEGRQALSRTKADKTVRRKRICSAVAFVGDGREFFFIARVTPESIYIYALQQKRQPAKKTQAGAG